MAGLLGKVESFDPELEEWPQYVERLEHFFDANGLTGEDSMAKRRSTFLSVIGPAPYKLLRSLLSPERPNEKTFEELTAVLANHYSPPPSEVMQRYRFNSRSREPGESVATSVVAELRRLAEFFHFGTTLNKVIRDRLVCGVNNESIQKKLLGEHNLTYERALAIAQSSEEADRNLREMRNLRPKGTSVTIKQEPVNQLPSGRNPRIQSTSGRELTVSRGACYRCGATGHKATDCRFKECTCHQCGKKGHLAKVCRSKHRRGAQSVRRLVVRRRQNQRWIWRRHSVW